MLTLYTLEQSEQWDAVVRSYKEYDAYWLSGYVKAFKIHGDGEPILFAYESDKVRGINVVMKRDIANSSNFKGLIEENKFFDFATPYGYGGWLIEGTDANELFDAYEQWCQKNLIVSEFVRFHPVLKNHNYSLERYDVIPLGYTVALDLTSPEVIWTNITSKNRNVIRKAQKNGIKIYSGRSPELYEVFREIYNGTMDKDNASDYYYFNPEFYESVCDDLAQNAQVFYAVLEGKIIATSIMLAANGYMNYHLSGSIKEYAHLAPSNLLLYHAALWGCANGCKTLYLGGGVGSGEDSLFKFKKSFYRLDDLPQFHIGKKIMNQEVYDELVNMRKELPESGFFPKYRIAD
ncbi:MAG: GNAT family N-acetyltransferase [Clostridia bacterium]|nr:GNAT family N-acetyltransferase [Clostridia bacterium]